MIKEHDWADDHEFNVWRCAMGIKQVKQINAAWEAYQAGKRAASIPLAQEDEPIYFARNGDSAIWFKPSANSLKRSLLVLIVLNTIKHIKTRKESSALP